MSIRRDPATSAVTPPDTVNLVCRRLLVVINHHEARVFRSLAPGSIPEQVRPEQADDAISHTHSFNGFSRGQEKPDPHRFFGPIAQALEKAGQILIFGSGTGTANQMDQFIAWVTQRDSPLAARIVGSLIIDENRLSEGQLLAKARDVFARPWSLRRPHTSRSRTNFALLRD